MKVLVAVLFVVASAVATGSGPYLPSGWRPDGPAFFLPSEVKKPVDNPLKETLFQETEASGSDALREYGPPKLEEATLQVSNQGLPDVITEQNFAVVETTDISNNIAEAIQVEEIVNKGIEQIVEKTDGNVVTKAVDVAVAELAETNEEIETKTLKELVEEVVGEGVKQVEKAAEEVVEEVVEKATEQVVEETMNNSEEVVQEVEKTEGEVVKDVVEQVEKTEGKVVKDVVEQVEKTEVEVMKQVVEQVEKTEGEVVKDVVEQVEKTEEEVVKDVIEQVEKTEGEVVKQVVEQVEKTEEEIVKKVVKEAVEEIIGKVNTEQIATVFEIVTATESQEPIYEDKIEVNEAEPTLQARTLQDQTTGLENSIIQTAAETTERLEVISEDVVESTEKVQLIEEVVPTVAEVIVEETVAEDVKNIAEALDSLAKEVKAIEVQAAGDVRELKINEEVSGTLVDQLQEPEGFLEYGPPGFREYGPPQEDDLLRAAIQVTSALDNNEVRRRRFSPKFRPSKKSH